MDYAIDRVRWAASEANKTANRTTGHHPSDAVGYYLSWTEDATGQLGNVLTADAVTDVVQTQAFWQLRAATGAEPRLLATVLHELRNRQTALEALADELRRWRRRWTSESAYVIVVPDTSMFLDPDRGFPDIDWRQVVDNQQSPLRVVVPLAVIDELDRLKRQGNSTTANRAKAAIRWLCGTLPLRLDARTRLDVPYDASIEVLTEATPRRLVDADLSIIGTTRQLATISGTLAVLVTRDLGMVLRARAGDVQVIHVVAADGSESKTR
jgi:hypothetical protein